MKRSNKILGSNLCSGNEWIHEDLTDVYNARVKIGAMEAEGPGTLSLWSIAGSCLHIEGTVCSYAVKSRNVVSAPVSVLKE